MIPILDLGKLKGKLKLQDIKIEAIHTREVKKNATGGKINFLKEHIGKTVYILIPEQDEFDEEEEEKSNKEKKK